MKCLLWHKDIVTLKEYSIDDFFKDKRLEIFIYETKSYSFVNSITINFYLLFNNDLKLLNTTDSSDSKKFYKKACLKCNTCIDEYEKGISYYLGILNPVYIKYLNDRKRNERAEKICKGEL